MTQASLRVPGKGSDGLLSLPSPQKLQCPGCSLGNVCTLLTPEDANRILALALGKTVVIVGASFIGMETLDSFAPIALSWKEWGLSAPPPTFHASLLSAPGLLSIQGWR